MPIRNASAVWNGTLKEGSGTMKLGSGAFEGAFSHGSRFGEALGTNPEEMIGAAHAGCFSMFLSALLTNAGFTPTSINTAAKVHLGEGPTITLIELETEAVVPNLDNETFQEKVDGAKKDCPISKALASVPLSVNAKLVN
jgi:osmotically inducible protein OsmC